MGRLSRKAKEKQKKELLKKVATLLMESLIGTIIAGLLLYIVIGDPSTLELIKEIQENKETLSIILIATPCLFVLISAINIGNAYIKGELTK